MTELHQLVKLVDLEMRPLSVVLHHLPRLVQYTKSFCEIYEQ
jgi:hypothetical protein